MSRHRYSCNKSTYQLYFVLHLHSKKKPGRDTLVVSILLRSSAMGGKYGGNIPPYDEGMDPMVCIQILQKNTTQVVFCLYHESTLENLDMNEY